jgi:mRNA degradation ribonuclease J1/J2
MTEKEVVSGPDVLIELGEKVGEHVVADRRLMADSGVIFIVLRHQQGKIKSVEVRSRGFIYMNMQHKIFEMIQQTVKDTWARVYDPARPEKVLAEPIEQNIQRLLLQKFKKEPIVEVVIG